MLKPILKRIYDTACNLSKASKSFEVSPLSLLKSVHMRRHLLSLSISISTISNIARYTFPRSLNLDHRNAQQKIMEHLLQRLIFFLLLAINVFIIRMHVRVIFIVLLSITNNTICIENRTIKGSISWHYSDQKGECTKEVFTIIDDFGEETMCCFGGKRNSIKCEDCMRTCSDKHELEQQKLE